MSDTRDTSDRSPTPVPDASLQSGLQPWIPFECLQVGLGQVVAEVDSVDAGAFQIVRERQLAGVQKLGVTPDDVCTISSCTPDPDVRFTEFRTGAVDEVFFLPARTEFDVYVPEGALTRYVSFSQEAFLDAARVLDPEGWGDARTLHVVPGRHSTGPTRRALGNRRPVRTVES
jgi:AraC family ethanolamine operon transcriptional activator